MSLLAFLGGRHDKKAWGRALFASGCKLPAKPDVKKYERATQQIISNDCKIIRHGQPLISAVFYGSHGKNVIRSDNSIKIKTIGIQLNQKVCNCFNILSFTLIQLNIFWTEVMSALKYCGLITGELLQTRVRLRVIQI